MNYKFRIWDKGRKEWLYDTEHAVSLLGETILTGSLLQRKDDSFVSFKDLNNLIIMQFTGLHDKNGVEIYESDIVEVRMSFEGGSLPCMGEIVYMEEFGAFATKNEGGETLLHNHLLNTFKVIGNIYEEKK